MTLNDRDVPFTYGGDEMSIRKACEYMLNRLAPLFLGRSVAEVREENIRLTHEAAQYKRASEEAYRDGMARILQRNAIIASMKKAIAVLEDRSGWLQEEVNRLADLVDYDALTGLLNRRGATEHLARMASALWHAAKQDGEPIHEKTLVCSIVYIDLDNFKPVNDIWGHARGDEVLRSVAELLRKTFSRKADLVARVGGDEFVVIMTHADMKGATKQAEHLLSDMDDDPRLLIDEDGDVRVGASIGVASMTLRPEAGGLSPDMVTSTLETTIRCADRAMYDAKRSGKGRISTYRC